MIAKLRVVVVNCKPIFKKKNCYLYFFNMNIDQMKRAIHIRCTQQFLYFESHKKSLKQLCTHYCLFQFTFYQYFKKWTISGTCTNNGSKIKLSRNRGRITFAWIWGLTGITFARRKGITIACKIYLQEFFFYIHLPRLPVI